MVYISGDGTVKEKSPPASVFAKIYAFFAFIILFFQSLIGMDSPPRAHSDANDYRDHLRRDNQAGGGRYDGAALGGGRGAGGGGGGDGLRRPIGRLARPSGMAPPPMGGGCCGGGGCG